ncbi:MAG: hypothetical protein K2X53_03780, partial [Alphaproteobacteria bacterium]|nr:hypothetical protein [Alphaproteobacteria bacterium]
FNHPMSSWYFVACLSKQQKSIYFKRSFGVGEAKEFRKFNTFTVQRIRIFFKLIIFLLIIIRIRIEYTVIEVRS